MRTGLAGVSVLAAVMTAAPVRAQETQIRVSGRVQVQYNTTAVDESDLGDEAASAASSTFETRRVRLGVRLTIDEWITGSLEPEYALGRLQLRQVWMNLGFDPRFEVRIGQFKKPFSAILLTSSLETASIERGLRIRELGGAYAFADASAGERVLGSWSGEPVLGEEQTLLDTFGYMGYELGASAHGMVGRFEYDVGVFNGTGPDARDDNDGKSYAGRVVWRTPTALPFAIGAAMSYHEVSTATSVAVSDGTAYEIDFELGTFRRAGLHVLGEATTGTNMAVDESLAGDRVDGVEPSLRLSWGDPNSEIADDAGILVTPGLSLYFAGRNRLQVNWDVYIPQGERFDTKHALRAQAQVAF
jgi:hypothetical protein